MKIYMVSLLHRATIKNYRPISLTCVQCKIMEAIIRDYIVDQLNDCARFSSSQHGFVKGRSCATNLLTAFEFWTEWLHQGFGIDTVYLDYKKAFDSVDHVKLIAKLHNNNVNYNMIKWIAAFLESRIMKVKAKAEFSDSAAVLSGVPQGSVLGPLLFLIFINDLPQWMRNSMLLMFADDTKISCAVSDEKDCALLQKDLDNLMKWTKDWHLNVEK